MARIAKFIRKQKLNTSIRKIPFQVAFYNYFRWKSAIDIAGPENGDPFPSNNNKYKHKYEYSIKLKLLELNFESIWKLAKK